MLTVMLLISLLLCPTRTASLKSVPSPLSPDTVMLNPNTQDSPSIKIKFKDYVPPPQCITFPELATVLEVASQEMAKVQCYVPNTYYIHVLMRDEEERKKEASKVKQTTRQSNTAHPRQSLFLRKMSCLGTSTLHFSLSFCSIYTSRRCLQCSGSNC